MFAVSYYFSYNSQLGKKFPDILHLYLLADTQIHPIVKSNQPLKQILCHLSLRCLARGVTIGLFQGDKNNLIKLK